MSPGRRVTWFLRENFAQLSWMELFCGPTPQRSLLSELDELHDAYRELHGRAATAHWDRLNKKLLLLRAQGRLTPAVFFRVTANHRGMKLRPGFLDNPERCDTAA